MHELLRLARKIERNQYRSKMVTFHSRYFSVQIYLKFYGVRNPEYVKSTIPRVDVRTHTRH
jgi:hypothetical protein